MPGDLRTVLGLPWERHERARYRAGTSHGPSAGRSGARCGLTVRPGRVSVGRWRCGLILMITNDDPGTMGRTRSRTSVPKGSASAARHTVSNEATFCAFGPYERLAPPPEVFDGSIQSHMTIEVM